MKVVVWFRDRLWSFSYLIDQPLKNGQETVIKKVLMVPWNDDGGQGVEETKTVIGLLQPGNFTLSGPGTILCTCSAVDCSAGC
jgi:hypothetical protein